MSSPPAAVPAGHEALPSIPIDLWINTFLFGALPYIALAVMIIGSIFRYDREPYTWRAGSSQLLRRKQLMWGSNLFHIGILFLFMGHFVGLLTPHSIYRHFISAETKQLVAIYAGSVAGLICLAGLVLLMHRRFFDARIRRNSPFADNAILAILFVQLVLGLATVPFSLAHHDAEVMLRLSAWAQGIFTFEPSVGRYVAGLDWPYQAHLVLGMLIFLLLPFTRLVHIFSAPIRYLWRGGYQIVRSRRSLTHG